MPLQPKGHIRTNRQTDRWTDGQTDSLAHMAVEETRFADGQCSVSERRKVMKDRLRVTILLTHSHGAL